MNSVSIRTTVVCVAAVVLLIPPLANGLQSRLLLHVLVQLPLLVWLGWYWAGSFSPRAIARINQFNQLGITGVVVVSLVALFWMLPRTLDAAIDDPTFAIAKALMLVVFFGAVLRLTIPVLHPIVSGVWQLEAWAMLMRLGWIYTVSPDRLCNNYLLSEQHQLGKMLLAIGSGWAFVWIIKVTFGLSLTPSRSRLRDLSKQTM